MAYYNITKSITLKLNYNNFVKVINTCSATAFDEVFYFLKIAISKKLCTFALY